MLSRILACRRGDLYVGFLVKFFCLICLVLTVINLFQVFITSQNINFVARRVARAIEVTGAFDSSIASYFDELRDTVGLQNATLTVEAPYLTGGRRIQLREHFVVTVSLDDEWVIFQPLGQKISFPLRFQGRIAGMSEVYWK